VTSAYPIPTAELVDRVRALAAELGEWPSQRRVMRECRVGAPRADAALATLRESGFDPAAPPRSLTVVPDLQDAAETHPVRVQEGTGERSQAHTPGAPDDAAEATTAAAEIDGESLVTGTAGASSRARRDWITDLGILVVGLAAAVITFTTLSALGAAVGITGNVLGLPLSWLLPVCIDAAGIVATRVWLRGQGSDEAVRFARLLALACIGLSIVANAGQHLLESMHATPE